MAKESVFKRRYTAKCARLAKEYPRFVPVKRSSLRVGTAKSYYGGCFPKVNGAKHKYPAPTDCDAWMYLIAEALTYRRLVRYCAQHRFQAPVDPHRSQFEYVLYHGRPSEKKRRATRNMHRQKLGLAVGDPRHVHHTDRTNLTLSKAVVLTPCQHRMIHGQVCHTKDPPIPKGAKRFAKPGHVPVSKMQRKKPAAPKRLTSAKTKKAPKGAKVTTAVTGKAAHAKKVSKTKDKPKKRTVSKTKSKK